MPAQFDSWRRERETGQHLGDLRQVAHEHGRQVDHHAAGGLVVTIGRLNSTLSV